MLGQIGKMRGVPAGEGRVPAGSLARVGGWAPFKSVAAGSMQVVCRQAVACLPACLQAAAPFMAPGRVKE
jgi:hypothetical protein